MKKHIVIPIVAVVFLLAIIGVKLNEGKSSSLEQKERIGIISAMDNEIKVLLDEADIKRVDQIGGVEYHVGDEFVKVGIIGFDVLGFLSKHALSVCVDR